MKDRYVIILGILLFLSMFFGYLLFEITNDLTATANIYKSDRDICERQYKELTKRFEKLEKKCDS